MDSFIISNSSLLYRSINQLVTNSNITLTRRDLTTRAGKEKNLRENCEEFTEEEKLFSKAWA